MKFAQVLSLLFVMAAGAANASPATLQIDPQLSSIQVLVTSTADSFVAELKKFDAQIQWTQPGKLPSQATVRFDFADLKTGNAQRDEAMLKWLDYSTHPAGQFQLTGWQQDGNTNLALGTLALHGVERTVASPIRITQTGPLWQLDGTAAFDYRQFELPKIRKALVLTVHPRLKVIYHLAGKLPGSP
jgi:polyisoprenoid-binding protein YceI